ncbi:unnamed protein product [Rhizophagus irregularis]|nr:unnamed protein product [Rhizophagus irregularis]
MSKETFQIAKRPEENQRVLGGVKPVFDGTKNMFTHKSLPFQDRSFDVKYVELEEDNAPMGSKRPFRRFTIRIRRTRDIFMDDLFRFLHAKGNMTWNCKRAITAMGTIISHEISINHPTIHYRNNEYLKQFGMEVSNNMTVVNARILPTPTIQYHPTSKENRIEPKHGVWDLKNKRVATGATLGSWSVLAFSNQRELPNQAIKHYLRELITTCNDMGMNIVMRDPPICHVDPSENTEESLKKAWFMAKEKARVKPQLILCILQHSKSDLYAEIKRVSDTVIGIATQYQPTILMGADITHPSPGNYERPSYAALYVLESELTAIKDACHSLEANYKPTITFVLVKKRRHTRFFPIERQNSDRTGNCLPGTVIETGITHPFEFDFYLLSHAGIMGTSRPTHYQVLYDENEFDANRLQTLTYNLCHTYARCTRSVSLVPPVYYANLAATRAKLYSSYDSDTGKTTFEAVKEALRKVMYFI